MSGEERDHYEAVRHILYECAKEWERGSRANSRNTNGILGATLMDWERHVAKLDALYAAGYEACAERVKAILDTRVPSQTAAEPEVRYTLRRVQNPPSSAAAEDAERPERRKGERRSGRIATARGLADGRYGEWGAEIPDIPYEAILDASNEVMALSEDWTEEKEAVAGHALERAVHAGLAYALHVGVVPAHDTQGGPHADRRVRKDRRASVADTNKGG